MTGRGDPVAVPPLARAGVDRAAHYRTDQAWLDAAWQRARVLVVDLEGRALVTDSPTDGAPELAFVTPAEAPAGDQLFLGVDAADVPYFAVVADLGTDLPVDLATDLGATPAGLRQVGAELSARDAGLLVTAVALAQWHARHPHSPASGAPTTVADGGWLRVDPAGNHQFPRTDPAIIVLVHDGVAGPDGRCLLGNNAAWPKRADGRRFFSTLAGFVEPGESAEAAVAREVREEVGIEVTRLRYEGSQAWPYPASLMLGFSGYADPGHELRPDLTEIAEARWFTRTEIAEGLAGVRNDLHLPGAASIARYLITSWLEAWSSGDASALDN